MKVRYDEGLASRIGPEPCAGVHVGIREGVHGDVCEASVGERIGQPLSRDSTESGCRRRANCGRQHGRARVIASARTTRRGQRPWHMRTLLVSGNRESSRSTARSMAAGPRQGGEEP